MQAKRNKVILGILVALVLLLPACTFVQCAGGVANNGDVNITQSSDNDMGVVWLFIFAVVLFVIACGLGMGAAAK
jgi:hypothetical protein